MLYRSWEEQKSMPHKHDFEPDICTRYVCLPRETQQKYWCEYGPLCGYVEDSCVDEDGQFACYFEEYNDLEGSRCNRKTAYEIIHKYDWQKFLCDRCMNEFRGLWKVEWNDPEEEDKEFRVLCKSCETHLAEMKTEVEDLKQECNDNAAT